MPNHPTLKEGFLEWEVIINPDLKFVGTETLKNGVKRYFGLDPITKKQKLMYIQYPKSHFSRSDMKRILPQYDGCKLCKIGKHISISNTSYLSSSTDIILPVIFVSSIVLIPLLYIIKIWYAKP